MKLCSTDTEESVDIKQEGADSTPENRVSYSDSSKVSYDFIEHIKNRFLVVN